MKSGCDVTYSEAVKDAIPFDIEGVKVPFASPKTLWNMKQTVRAKDIPDRLYLRQLLQNQGTHLDNAPGSDDRIAADLWARIKAWWKKRDSP